MRRPLTWASLLLLASGGLAYAASRAEWAHADAHDGLGAPRHVRVLGAEFAPLSVALALLLVAAVPAVFAAKGWTLRAVAALIVLAGGGLAWTGADWLRDEPDPAQFGRLAALPERYQIDHLDKESGHGALPLASGTLAVAAAAFALRASGAARGLGSRFDSPGAKKDRPEDERSDWARLDAGEDPTVGPER